MNHADSMQEPQGQLDMPKNGEYDNEPVALSRSIGFFLYKNDCVVNQLLLSLCRVKHTELNYNCHSPKTEFDSVTDLR